MKWVALVDCNSFYCSCERVFRPELTNKPIAVLSNNDGCFVSRTDEAKNLGLPMGAPYFKFKDFCRKNDITVFSSNYTLYGDMSARVMKVLSEFSQNMEMYSIDEAFLDLSHLKREEIPSTLKHIQETVRQYTGIPVSIGVGTTKVLAKAANIIAKKNKTATSGLFELIDPPSVDEHLIKIKSGDIWGIGYKSAEKLARHGINTALDLKNAHPALIKKLLTIVGWRIQRELWGESQIEIESLFEDRKHIMSTRSFGRGVYDIEELREAIANHVTNAAEKLREQKSVARNISVFIRTNPFKPDFFHNSTTVELPVGSSATNRLIKHAFDGLDKIYHEGREYKKVGIILHDFFQKGSEQLSFLESHDSHKNDQLMDAMDRINRRQGKNTLKFAACGINQFWKMLSQLRSPHYTTRWTDLPEID